MIIASRRAWLCSSAARASSSTSDRADSALGVHLPPSSSSLDTGRQQIGRSTECPSKVAGHCPVSSTCTHVQVLQRSLLWPVLQSLQTRIAGYLQRHTSGHAWPQVLGTDAWHPPGTTCSANNLFAACATATRQRPQGPAASTKGTPGSLQSVWHLYLHV